MTTETWQDASNEIRQLFRETSKQFEKTGKQFEKTGKQFEKTGKQLEETGKQIRETDERLTKQIKATDELLTRQIMETDKRFKETSREINKLSGLFTNQWGKMIEALVRPNALKLFQDRGIDVYSIYRRVEIQRKERTMEVDLLLENDDEVVVIEAKTVLRVNDVQYFLEQLKHFLYFFPHYQGRHIYGAVAGLDIAKGADKYAYRQGLFVLDAIGGGVAQIKNDIKFMPTDFGTETEC